MIVVPFRLCQTACYMRLAEKKCGCIRPDMYIVGRPRVSREPVLCLSTK